MEDLVSLLHAGKRGVAVKMIEALAGLAGPRRVDISDNWKYLLENRHVSPITFLNLKDHGESLYRQKFDIGRHREPPRPFEFITTK